MVDYPATVLRDVYNRKTAVVSVIAASRLGQRNHFDNHPYDIRLADKLADLRMEGTQSCV